MSSLRIAIIGFGKIARNLHVPAMTAADDFVLDAVVDPGCKGGMLQPPHNGRVLLLS